MVALFEFMVQGEATTDDEEAHAQNDGKGMDAAVFVDQDAEGNAGDHEHGKAEDDFGGAGEVEASDEPP